MISGTSDDSEGNLWVMDPVASRFTVFSSDGTLQGPFARPPSFTTTISWLGRLDRDGLVYDLTAPMPSAAASARDRDMRLKSWSPGVSPN